MPPSARPVCAALSLVLLIYACGGRDVPTAPDASADAATSDTAPSTDVGVTPTSDVPWRCERRRPAPTPSPERCNGAAELCARRFDAVSLPTTHNAMSTREDGFIGPNQVRTMARQLDDGVRGMMLDVHPSEGDAWLCHGYCNLGRRRFAEGLCDIGQFLDSHPSEVLGIILENYVPAEQVARAVTEAGLREDLHTQTAGAPWPTLREMIASGRRVVLMTDNGGGGANPWLHPMWDLAFENPYAAATPAEFTCRMNRGRAGNGLFIFNHFLTAPIALPSLAEMVNHNPGFLERARRCQTERGHLPNFVTVDFYETGDLFAVTRALNGLP